MNKLFQMSSLLLLISSATAQEASPQQTTPPQTPKTLRVYDWKDLARQQTLPGEVISIDGISVLKVDITNGTPKEIALLRISDASVIEKGNSIYGEFKYENVQGNPINSRDSHLDFVNRIAPAASGGDTNTSLELGPILSGTSNWHPYHFTIFRSKTFDGQPRKPTQLELRLVLEGSGTFYFRPIRILGMTSNFTGWWSPQQSSLIGGIGGSVIGCFGALIGILASKGKARNFVLTSIRVSIVVGILLMIAGLVALAYKQPYAVWYALLLPGVILTSVFSLNLSSLQRRYDELEIRRMTSVDTMGS